MTGLLNLGKIVGRKSATLLHDYRRVPTPLDFSPRYHISFDFSSGIKSVLGRGLKLPNRGVVLKKKWFGRLYRSTRHHSRTFPGQKQEPQREVQKWKDLCAKSKKKAQDGYTSFCLKESSHGWVAALTKNFFVRLTSSSDYRLVICKAISRVRIFFRTLIGHMIEAWSGCATESLRGHVVQGVIFLKSSSC